MHVIQIECRTNEEDDMVARLWEAGTAGVIEDALPGGVLLRAFFEAEVPGLAEECGGRWERQEDRDWVAVSQAQWEPVLVGSRFFLVPDWRDDPAPPGRLRLEMHPGLVCGTGWHASTQLVLEAMERHVRIGAAVLDVGTGSGILSAAAAMLGASRVFACDIDRAAVTAASERFLDSRAEVGLFAGSVRSVRSAAIDVLVANINAETLVSLAPDIARVRKPGGVVILGGFPRRHLGRVQARYGKGEILEKDGWTALVC